MWGGGGAFYGQNVQVDPIGQIPTFNFRVIIKENATIHKMTCNTLEMFYA